MVIRLGEWRCNISTSVTFNGVSYTVPAIADASWGTNVSNYLIAIASGCLQKTGGAFTLSAADVDFGATYGLKAVYFKSKTANIAAAGVLQLARTDVISWRNQANGADLSLSVDSSNVLSFNGAPLVNLSLGGAYTVLQMNAAATAYSWATPTGTGAPVLQTSPSLTTPTLGVATATSINKMAITAPATSSTLAIADGKTATVSNTLTFAGTDGKTMTFSNSLTFAGTDGNTMTFPSGSSTVMTLASADTISGIKTFGDAKLVLSGSSSGAMTVKAPAAASTFVATFFAATDTVVGLTFQQTITNKILSDSTIKFGNVSDTTKALLFSLGGATTAKTMTLISSHTNDRSITFPDATDTLVGKSTTDALTNKDYQGGTASNSSRLTVPSASTSTLSGLTRKQATLVYDTTLNALFSDDGSNLNPVGSGAGEKNYISSGSNNAAGWTASAAGVTVATDTTAADLPRSITTKSGILISRASGSTAYAYYRFTLDPVDYNRKLKIKFDQKPGGSFVASDFKVDMYSNTASDYSGTSTRLALSTDSSAISALPNATQQYQTTFDSPGSSATYMELRVGLNASTSGTTICISDVIVGPGIQPQGAVDGPWIAYTPTFTGWGTATGISCFYKRTGQNMWLDITFTAGTLTATNQLLSLPSGFNVDTSFVGSQSIVCGVLGSSGNTAVIDALIDSGSTTTIGFGISTNGRQTLTSGVYSATNITGMVGPIPISQWAGSGTVNIVQNDVEYVYNTSGTTSAGGSDTTSFGYGPGGVAIGNIASTTPSGSSKTGMRVRFVTPIQVTDRLDLEFDEGTNGARWTPSAVTPTPFITQGAAYYGAYLSIVNATDVDVFFGNGGATTGASYAANGSTTWTNITSWKWRVKKIAGGQAVGFSNVAQSTSGLVKSAGQLLGTNTNDSAAAGFVGEVLAVTRARGSSLSISNNSAANVCTTGGTNIVLTPGDWDIRAFADFTTGTTTTQLDLAISQTSATFPSANTLGNPIAGEYWVSTAVTYAAAGNDEVMQIPSYQVTVASGATLPLYLVARIFDAGGSPSVYGRLEARRMR